MPCSDISENLKIVLDHEDRVTFYALSKSTCSGAVGKPSLLKKWIKNRTADQVLAATPDCLAATYPTKSKTWQFLYAKHLHAVQSALRALSGDIAGRPTDYCAIHSVTYTSEGLEMYAIVNLDLMTEEIESCGNCASCS